MLRYMKYFTHVWHTHTHLTMAKLGTFPTAACSTAEKTYHNTFDMDDHVLCTREGFLCIIAASYHCNNNNQFDKQKLLIEERRFLARIQSYKNQSRSWKTRGFTDVSRNHGIVDDKPVWIRTWRNVWARTKTITMHDHRARKSSSVAASRQNERKCQHVFCFAPRQNSNNKFMHLFRYACIDTLGVRLLQSIHVLYSDLAQLRALKIVSYMHACTYECIYACICAPRLV